jgi:hydroxyacylglutathione hydrolase
MFPKRKIIMEKIKTIKLSFVNAYLVNVKDGFILIDTGLNIFREQLENELLKAGALPKKLKAVIITHGDFDHTGNCSVLQKKYKVKIAMHKDDAFMVEKGIRPKRKVRTLKGMIMMFLSKLNSKKFKFDKFKPDILLTDGMSLSKYGFDAKVIHLPGHTKGSIGILTKEGNMFIGDILALTKKGKTDISRFIENMADIKKSIEKIKTLKIKEFFPGHGPSFKMKDLI